MKKLTILILALFLTCGQVNASQYFQGSADLYNCGSASALDDLGPMTVSFWIYAINAGGSSLGRLVCKDAVNTGQWTIRWDGDAATILFVKDYDGVTDLSLDTAGLGSLIGSWNHIVITWDGANLRTGVKFYKNGNLIGTTGGADGAGNKVTDAARSLFIGNQIGGTRQSGSIMTDVAIWNKVLTQQEIQFISKSRLKRLPLQIQTTNLVGYWEFNNGGNSQYDLTSNNSKCTASGAPSYKPDNILSYP